MPSSLATRPFSTRSSKNARSSARSLSSVANTDLSRPSAKVASSDKIGERDLRLDHPELGEVARGVGVLGPERRAEGVDLGEREAVGLDVELARHGEERLAAEEVLREVDLAVARARQVGEVERRDAEQRAGALGVRRGDDRGVDPEEAVVVEVAVDRLGQRVAHARRRADDVGARPQVRDLAQIFHGVVLGRDRIGVRVVDPADHLDARWPASRTAGPWRARARSCRSPRWRSRR